MHSSSEVKSKCRKVLQCMTQEYEPNLAKLTARAAAGFQNLATEELCARWIAVGAWQPFARVHHAQSFQELYR